MPHLTPYFDSRPSLMFGLADGVVLPIIPLVARATGASDKVVGIVSSSRAIGKLLADLPAGMFFSNFGSSRCVQSRVVSCAYTCNVGAWMHVGFICFLPWNYVLSHFFCLYSLLLSLWSHIFCN